MNMSTKSIAETIKAARDRADAEREQSLADFAAILGREVAADEHGRLLITESELRTIGEKYEVARVAWVYRKPFDELRSIPIVVVPTSHDSTTTGEQ